MSNMYMNCMKGNTGFRECSGALIVCIGNGQSVLRPYMVNSKDVKELSECYK
ncbi:hypothetical protein Tco_0898587, partial [Tanacetum coccineum]